MALYQYKKISLYRKNATVVLQVLQKILSLLTSGKEKKVCKYQSTVFYNASNQLHLNPSSATAGKTPHNTRPQSGQNTDCLQEDKNWGATKLFSNIVICLSHNNRPSFESIKLLTLTHSSPRLEHSQASYGKGPDYFRLKIAIFPVSVFLLLFSIKIRYWVGKLSV